jgi:hypothetical protein
MTETAGQGGGLKAVINMTPMIDVLLVLLLDIARGVGLTRAALMTPPWRRGEMRSGLGPLAEFDANGRSCRRA